MKDDGPGSDARTSRGLGATRGSWWIAMLVIVLAVAGAVTLLVLVRAGDIPREWAYVSLPMAGIAAAAARVLTILKAGSEEKKAASRRSKEP